MRSPRLVAADHRQLPAQQLRLEADLGRPGGAPGEHHRPPGRAAERVVCSSWALAEQWKTVSAPSPPVALLHPLHRVLRRGVHRVRRPQRPGQLQTGGVEVDRHRGVGPERRASCRVSCPTTPAPKTATDSSICSAAGAPRAGPRPPARRSRPARPSRLPGGGRDGAPPSRGLRSARTWLAWLPKASTRSPSRKPSPPGPHRLHPPHRGVAYLAPRGRRPRGLLPGGAPRRPIARRAFSSEPALTWLRVTASSSWPSPGAGTSKVLQIDPQPGAVDQTLAAHLVPHASVSASSSAPASPCGERIQPARSSPERITSAPSRRTSAASCRSEVTTTGRCCAGPAPPAP